MKPAEFEEKEYEGFLYSQLETARSNVWSPGQVFERHIGIDRAMFVRSPRVWRTLGRTMAAGVFLNRYNWDHIWHQTRRRPMPNFRLNLFIQAKRPMAFKRAPRHISAAGLNPPGWCFGVEPHQQLALESVASRIGRRAAILYAAPAFHTLTQLFGHARMGTVVKNSTFPDVLRLRGHSKWYYNQAGGNGVANPNAEPSKGPSLDETIEKLLLGEEGAQTTKTSDNLAELSKTILSAIHDGGLKDNPRVARFFEELRLVERELAGLEVLGEEIRNFYSVAAFTEIFNVEWFTIA
jgi:hypothetical protein